MRSRQTSLQKLQRNSLTFIDSSNAADQKMLPTREQVLDLDPDCSICAFSALYRKIARRHLQEQLDRWRDAASTRNRSSCSCIPVHICRFEGLVSLVPSLCSPFHILAFQSLYGLKPSAAVIERESARLVGLQDCKHE